MNVRSPRLLLSLFLALSSPGAFAGATNGTVLHVGPEIPVTEAGEPVPVAGANHVQFSAGEGRLAFWSDSRAASGIFFTTTPLAAEAGDPFGTPLEPFRGYAGQVVGAVPAGGHHLLVTLGSPADGTPGGFHALPIANDGTPLASAPLLLRVIEGNLYERFAVVVAENRPLLVWLQDATINAIQLSPDGQIIQELVIAPELAETVQYFAIAAVADRYLLLMGVKHNDESYRALLWSLSPDLETVATREIGPAQQYPTMWLSGGESRGLLVTIQPVSLHGEVLSADGTPLQSREIAAGSAPPHRWSMDLAQRSAGWRMAWAPQEWPSGLNYAEISLEGEQAFFATVDAKEQIHRVIVADGDSPLIAVDQTEYQPFTRHVIAFLDGTRAWRRLPVSSLSIQRIHDVASGGHTIGIMWTDQRPYPHRPIVSLFSPHGTMTIDPGIPAMFDGTLASDGTRFLLSAYEPLDWRTTQLRTRWLDEEGVVSEPLQIMKQFGSSTVTTWSGTNFLTFWSEITGRLLSEDIKVTVLFGTAAFETHPFWPDVGSDTWDVLCDDRGCVAAWMSYKSGIPNSDRSYVAPITRDGHLAAPALALTDERRAMRLARADDLTIIVSHRSDYQLDAHWVTPDAIVLRTEENLGTAAGFDTIGLGSAAVAVWGSDGAILGCTLSANEFVSPVQKISASEWPAENPRLAQLDGQTFVIYERLDPDAGHVPRLFARRISETERRRTLTRR